MKAILVSVSALLGIVAAGLWIFASYQEVHYDPEERDESGLYPAVITEQKGERTIDVLKTAENQTKWNGWAALVTGLAALANALSLMV
jgi:hypothetical protein